MPNIQTINLIQNYVSLIAYFLLTILIYRNLQRSALKYFVYLFVFALPILVIIGRYFLYRKIDPFYMYTDLCILCDKKAEHYINFLRIAFYAVSVSVFAPLFKLDKFYQFVASFGYYVGFYALSIFIYTVVLTVNLNLLFWLCQIIVAGVIIKRIRPFFQKN